MPLSYNNFVDYHKFVFEPNRVKCIDKEMCPYETNAFYFPCLIEELPDLTVYYRYEQDTCLIVYEACMPISRKADRQVVEELCNIINEKGLFDVMTHDDLFIATMHRDIRTATYYGESDVYTFFNQMLLNYFNSKLELYLLDTFNYLATGDEKYIKTNGER